MTLSQRFKKEFMSAGTDIEDKFLYDLENLERVASDLLDQKRNWIEESRKIENLQNRVNSLEEEIEPLRALVKVLTQRFY